MATLADIAKIAGVGVMSVSRVVNGTRSVNPETERKVRAAIEKIGYRPNEAARILRGHHAQVIGLIVPDLADPFFAIYANTVHETAWEAGYMTLMAASAHRIDVERREMEFMIERRVAGMLVTPAASDYHHFETAKKNDVPIVSFDRPMDGMDVDVFVVDNRAAAAKATQHLIEHKHRNILCIADDENIFTKAERVAGYSEAMRRAQLPVRTCFVGPISGPLPRQLEFALHSTPPPTAIFATSDVIALGVLRELQKRSIPIPGKIALIAFDDFDAATLVRPTVTVVRQPIAELGRRATSALLNRIGGGFRSEPGLRVTLPTELVIRESCGCAGANKRKALIV
ncbi:MAG TPA: LacI family DNA-binding transcriptional regulator [Rhizomicrobium sp.]|jgi:LacI family transcriptional regulator|nr:LacI family DNA-binding transcriptional regulator [Rhizomicrobium sp.]